MTNFLFILGQILQEESSHIIVQALAFSVGFLLILTTYYFVLKKSPGNAWLQETRIKCFIAGLGLFSGLVFLWLFHGLMDGFVFWYTTPLGPPLELILK